MKPKRVIPRWPVYRFECMDCEANEIGLDLPSLRSMAAIHAEDDGHETGVLKLLSRYEPAADPVFEGSAR